ncbi:hypothetical protein [Delftia sp. GW456-R20]|uniref:hypothetical protein n=1 Tax=Delftia sp. GW456-R20 TaxID=1827145 RepID=UPI0012E918F6|nr:hypothetical protein [Delftia sp. GW456-R20]
MLSKRITDAQYRIVVDGHASHWQHWFHKAINEKTSTNDTRLTPNDATYYRLAAAESSLPRERSYWPVLVVLDFCNSRTGIEDPITYINPEEFSRAFEGDVGAAFDKYHKRRERNPDY